MTLIQFEEITVAIKRTAFAGRAHDGFRLWNKSADDLRIIIWDFRSRNGINMTIQPFFGSTTSYQYQFIFCQLRELLVQGFNLVLEGVQLFHFSLKSNR